MGLHRVLPAVYAAPRSTGIATPSLRRMIARVDRRVARLLLGALLLSATTAFLHISAPSTSLSQERRLSTQPQLFVPTGLRIQSAAAIGKTTFVVWGSIGVDSSGRFDSLLVGQPVIDGVATGTPLRLTAPTAAPCHLVRVVRFDSTFVVIWSDRRSDSAGAWSQPFGREGQPLGPAQRFAVVRPLADSVVATVQDGRHATLAWPLGDSVLGLITINNMGRLVKLDSMLNADLAESGPLTNTAALQIPGRDETRLVLADGSAMRAPALTDPRTLAALVRSDGSLAVLRASELLFYPTLEDTVPTRRVTVGAMGRAISSRFALLELPDGLGVDRLVETCNVSGDGDCYLLLLTRAFVADSTTRIDSLAFSQLAQDYGCYRWESARYSGSSGSDPITVTARNPTGYVARMRIWGSYTNPPTGRSWYKSGYLGFDVDGDGAWVENSTAPAFGIALGAAPAPRVVRISDSMRSTVAVGSDSVVVRSEIAVGAQFVGQSYPIAYRMSGHYRVAWLDSMSTESGPQIWVIRGELPSSPATVQYRVTYVPSVVSRDNMVFRTHGGMVFAAVTANRRLYPTEYSFQVLHDVVREWRPSIQSGFGAPSASAAHEPDSDELAVVWTAAGGITEARARCYDTTVRLHFGHSERLSGRPLPLQGSRMLFVSADNVQVLDSCRLVATTSSPPGLWRPNMLRLRDNQILTWEYFDSCECVLFDRFRFHAPVQIVHNASGRLSTRGGDVCPIESPEDGSLVVLVGGEGVTLHRLSKRLVPTGAPRLLTEGTHLCRLPHGIFLNGSLLAVWEDHRARRSEIYGTTVNVEAVDEPPLPSTESRDATPRIVPTPADGELRVEIGMQGAETVTCDLLDASGRLIAVQTSGAPPTGSVMFFFATRHLPNGVYVVRTRRGMTTAFSYAVVLHPR